MAVIRVIKRNRIYAAAEKHEYETVQSEFICGGIQFTVFGASVLKSGWKDFEDAFRRSCRDFEEEKNETGLLSMVERAGSVGIGAGAERKGFRISR